MKRRGMFKGRGLGPMAIASAALDQEFDCPEYGDEPFDRAGDGAIAIVTIEGPLTQKPCWFWDNYEAIAARCAAAFKSSARVVLLDINSPGGDVAGCFDLARSLRAQAIASKKRLVAFTDGMAASAAYALASAAPEIFVSSTGYVGSIGVINQLVDMTAADRAMGLTYRVIASGERKKDGNVHAPITDEAENELYSQVNALADLFFEWVGETRGAEASALKGFDGALFFGANAAKVGLANGVTTKSDLLASLARAPSASAAGTSEATMADEKEKEKSYEDEMRAKLEEDVKSDDEKKSAAAKKMLAALDGDGDGDGDEDKEKKAKAEEEEKKEADAKAKAEDEKKDAEAKAKAAGSVMAAQAAEISSLKARLDANDATNDAKARAELYASRNDLPEATLKALDGMPVAQAKAVLATIPVQKLGAAAAAASVGGSRGKSQASAEEDRKDVEGLDQATIDQIDRAMGISKANTGIKRTSDSLVLGAMTRAEARAHLEKLEKEGH